MPLFRPTYKLSGHLHSLAHNLASLRGSWTFFCKLFCSNLQHFLFVLRNRAFVSLLCSEVSPKASIGPQD